MLSKENFKYFLSFIKNNILNNCNYNYKTFYTSYKINNIKLWFICKYCVRNKEISIDIYNENNRLGLCDMDSLEFILERILKNNYGLLTK